MAGVHADQLVQDEAGGVAGEVPIGVVGHVHKRGGVRLTPIVQGERHAILGRGGERVCCGDPSVAGKTVVAVCERYGEGDGGIILRGLGVPDTLVQAVHKIGVEVVAGVRTVVLGHLVRGLANGDLAEVRAIGGGAYGRAVAGGVVEVAVESVEPEDDILRRAVPVGRAEGEEGCPEVHDAGGDAIAGELI